MGRIKKLIKLLEHNEKLLNLLTVICCLGLFTVIALYCWLFG